MKAVGEILDGRVLTRDELNRTAGWISPLVLLGGRVAGTWEQSKGELVVSIFDGVPVPVSGISALTDRLALATGQPIEKVRAA